MSMKINRLEIENVKRIKAVKLEPAQNGLTIIGGDNQQGKTSVLDSIAWALGGERYKPSQSTREGSMVPPNLHIVMNNGLVVERKGKNSALKVTDPNGQKAGQQLLNEFVEQLALDLPRFMEASGTEKAKVLLQIIGVGPQLAELEKEEKELYQERLYVGRTADQKEKFAKEQPYYPEAPRDLVSPSELIRQQQEILAKNGENQRKRDQAAQLRDSVKRAHEEVIRLSELLEAAKQKHLQLVKDLDIAETSAKDLTDQSTEELEANISNIEEINRKVRANLDKEKAEDDAKEYRTKYDNLTKQLEEARDKKKELLTSAELPLPELSVKDGELIYKGQKWDNMSGAERLKVSTAIVRKLNPQCGFVLLDKLEQMDRKTLQEFGEWLEAEGLQAIATRVSTGDECSIIIEDGYVVGQEHPEKRLGSFPADYFNTIIIDEAHHCISDSYQRVLQHFPEAQVLGVTATPDRGDMRNLGVYFESLAYEYTLPKAIKEGYLSPIKALTIPLKIDMSNVSVQAGDFKASEIGTALDPYLEGIAQEMQKYCMDKKTVVFLPLVKTSQKFRDLLNAYGFQAAEVNGDSQDRAEVLKDFDAGKYNVLCNSMLLTEGWDCPSVDCIVVLRPTKVRSLYCQMVGRGTRLSPETGKDHLLLLDFLWHTERHELCHPASLICENEEVAQKMTENLEQEAGIVVDIEEAEKTASEDVVAQREEALAKQLSEMKKRKGRLVDPLQFEMSIQAEDLSNYVPSFGWEMGPPSDKQKHTLEKLGIMPDQIENAGKAAKILDRLDKRKNEGLTTPKQIRYLESKGFQHVGTWQFDTAKNLIDRIAGNGWKIPNDIVPQEYKGA